MPDRLADRAGMVLPSAEPRALGLDPDRLERLYALVETHVAEQRYPGAQLAVARHGRLAAFRTFGHARLDPPTAASDQTLWLLYSQTKPVVSAAICSWSTRARFSSPTRSPIISPSSPAMASG